MWEMEDAQRDVCDRESDSTMNRRRRAQKIPDGLVVPMMLG